MAGTSKHSMSQRPHVTPKVVSFSKRGIVHASCKLFVPCSCVTLLQPCLVAVKQAHAHPLLELMPSARQAPSLAAQSSWPAPPTP